MTHEDGHRFAVEGVLLRVLRPVRKPERFLYPGESVVLPLLPSVVPYHDVLGNHEQPGRVGRGLPKAVALDVRLLEHLGGQVLGQLHIAHAAVDVGEDLRVVTLVRLNERLLVSVRSRPRCADANPAAQACQNRRLLSAHLPLPDSRTETLTVSVSSAEGGPR